MPYAIFAAIICFGLTHAPESNWDLQDLTKEKTANDAVSSFVARPPPNNEQKK